MPWPRQRCKNASSAAVLAHNYTVSRSSIPKQASLLSFAMPCYNMVSSELTEARVQLRPSGVATKPRHVEATPLALDEVQLRPSVVAAKPRHVAATPPAVDERQLILYRRMRFTLNLSTNENNARSYIFRYGTLSEDCPFGERVWDGLQKDFIGYRFSFIPHDWPPLLGMVPVSTRIQPGQCWACRRAGRFSLVSGGILQHERRARVHGVLAHHPRPAQGLASAPHPHGEPV